MPEGPFSQIGAQVYYQPDPQIKILIQYTKKPP